ncbi:ammonium transporter [Acetobacter sp.]|jgi:ammonia channel protein AmtB|uniref:ammonium transporter n=1 Tax=Acetobacter sp. TaxID=440 RepID=UPI0025BA498A|nr:ammonium transporter [Acetobacter sp.]MCH4091052.1 ammonium transporter [Acetobacter sp.]MCI1300235.1 ammonium transporter [Acetobacter sp.]MCI1316097.1 ammonium transporter [Acetobacter sp.]
MFPEQVSTANILSAFIYVVSAVSVILVLIGLGLVDAGLVRKDNVLHCWVQKITTCMIGGLATFFVGDAIWQWQFYTAFGTPHPFWQAFLDWWPGSAAMSTPALAQDPKLVPGADTQQVFSVFFVTFAMATVALIHSGTVERIRSAPLYVMSLATGLIFCPLAAYLTWGPLSPLTNNGLHDFEGAVALYVFTGTWTLVTAWRMGPRAGVFTPDPDGIQPKPSNYGNIAAGALFVFMAIPLIALGSTWIAPGKSVYGITMVPTGLGIVLKNVFLALLGGGVSGATLAALLREPVWVFFGPIAGAVMTGTLFDVAGSMESLAFGVIGPILAVIVSRVLVHLRIDEPKVAPLAFGPGIVGSLAGGFLHWGTGTGGFTDLPPPYALDHAHITPLFQLVGIITVILLSAIPAYIICRVFEATSGLRISRECERNGMDMTYWGHDKG